MLVYNTLHAHLTNAPYIVTLPAWYDRDYEAVMEGDLLPIASVDTNISATLRSARTIDQMLELVKNDVLFTICDDFDTISIKHYLEEFVTTELIHTPVNDSVREFMRLATTFHDRLVILSIRILRKNGVMRQWYINASPSLKSILAKLESGSQDQQNLVAGLTKLPDITNPHVRSSLLGEPIMDTRQQQASYTYQPVTAPLDLYD